MPSRKPSCLYSLVNLCDSTPFFQAAKSCVPDNNDTFNQIDILST